MTRLVTNSSRLWSRWTKQPNSRNSYRRASKWSGLSLAAIWKPTKWTTEWISINMFSIDHLNASHPRSKQRPGKVKATRCWNSKHSICRLTNSSESTEMKNASKTWPLLRKMASKTWSIQLKMTMLRVMRKWWNAVYKQVWRIWSQSKITLSISQSKSRDH